MCKKNVTSVTVPINRLTYLVHAKSTSELPVIGFGFSED